MMAIITRDCAAPDNRARIGDYAARVAAQPDFSVLTHSARARRGLLLQRRLRRRPSPAESVGRTPEPLQASASPSRAARETDNAAIPFRYRFNESADADLPPWHPDHPHYAGP